MHRLGLNHDMTSVVQTKVSGEAEGVVTSLFCYYNINFIVKNLLGFLSSTTNLILMEN